MIHVRRHRLRLGLLAGLVLALAFVRASGAAAVSEYELKLALTYKIARFVTWPAEREGASEFALCLLGDNPFDSALDDIVGLEIRSRPITVVHIASISAADACDLVYIARSEADEVAEILADFSGKPLLTVSDLPNFAARGGIVELQSRGTRIGFEINVAAYRLAGLSISSQLLQLATLVDGTAEAGR